MTGDFKIACDPINVFVKWHHKLIDLATWVVDFTGEIIITSALRMRTLYPLDSGIHTHLPLRALDIRSRIYNDPEKLCEVINNKFKYDKLRPDMKCAIYHDTGLGIHIHLQVHDRTNSGL